MTCQTVARVSQMSWIKLKQSDIISLNLAKLKLYSGLICLSWKIQFPKLSFLMRVPGATDKVLDVTNDVWRKKRECPTVIFE